MILKIQITNLDYYSVLSNEVFNKFYICNKNLQCIKPLRSYSLESSKYGEDIGYEDTVIRCLPKIPYIITLAFAIPKIEMEYAIVIKDFKVEGLNVEKINLTRKDEKTKKVQNKIKCPKCGSNHIVKDGKKTENRDINVKSAKENLYLEVTLFQIVSCIPSLVRV